MPVWLRQIHNVGDTALETFPSRPAWKLCKHPPERRGTVSLGSRLGAVSTARSSKLQRAPEDKR